MQKTRSRDAREKILLGGLAVKAGLRNADAAFLLGGLLELRAILDCKDDCKDGANDQTAIYNRLYAMGQAAFKSDKADAQAAAKAFESVGRNQVRETSDGVSAPPDPTRT